MMRFGLDGTYKFVHLLFQMIDRSTAKDKLVVKVSEANVTFSVFMESGTLVIQVAIFPLS